MRFIGNKTSLLENIEDVIHENCNGNERVFCDMFSGTTSVARYFKGKYKIISNDLLYFSYVLQNATIKNNKMPQFKGLKEKYGIEDVFDYLETESVKPNDNYFIYKNYSPNNKNDRMYLSPENAIRIDFIRQKINEWYEEKTIGEDEYYYLLASLIEGIPFVSNITGTYGAYLKKWDKRALKKFELVRLNIVNNNENNETYCKDANELIKKIHGDILYLDPPYNSRQYLPNYHILETVAKYDYPDINGKTGIREYTKEKSKYCVKAEVYEALDDLIKNANFTHIIVSYNQDGILTEKEIEEIMKKYGNDQTYKIYKIPYKQYQNKLTKKVENHYEYIFYIKKDSIINERTKKAGIYNKEKNREYNVGSYKKYIKSPLNYIGGKYKILPQIIQYFPDNINTFVDLFAGGFNVGINVTSQKTVCNDINDFIIELYEKLYNVPTEEVLSNIYKRIDEFGLSKENEQAYNSFRNYYNANKNPIDLYTLTCYSFNYQFRFNNNKDYNNPFGRNRSQFSENMKNNLILFSNKLKNMNVEFSSKDFDNYSLDSLGENDFIYCDPPYLITTGSYNDGNRGFKDWNEETEKRLYEFLDNANERRIKFALSNVLNHKGRENTMLKLWSSKYKTIFLENDYSNSSYNTTKGKSQEVLIINY